MTKEDALYWYLTLVNRCECRHDFDAPEDAQIHYDAIAALRGPQPDPGTGLVPCGCGGALKLKQFDNMFRHEKLYTVGCVACNWKTDIFTSEEKAIVAANTAMGWRASE